MFNVRASLCAIFGAVLIVSMLSATAHATSERAAIVTHYVISALGDDIDDGTEITMLPDVSGYSNDALATAVRPSPVYVRHGVGRRPSLRFTEISTSQPGAGYVSTRSMGSDFGIEDDAPWTLMAVIRLENGTIGGHILGLGNGYFVNGLAAYELDHQRFDLATGFGNDPFVAKSSENFDRFLLRDIIWTVSYAGNGTTIKQGTNFFFNGIPLGESWLKDLSKDATGNASAAPLRLVDAPLTVGGNINVGLRAISVLVAEVIVFNRALTTPQRLRMERSLGKKYGIPTY